MNIDKIRKDFPILCSSINNHPLVYLDNAATGQIPKQVVMAMNEHIYQSNANIHRGIHTLSNKSSDLYESARKEVAKFLNTTPSNIIFTASTTDSIHLVSSSLEKKLMPGDEVLVSQMEHHSNFIPWQQICHNTGALLRVIPLNQNGDISLHDLEKMFTKKTRFLCVTQCSNVTGIAPDVEKICNFAHSQNIMVLVDGAQGSIHLSTDVAKMDCDFYCFSAHKLMGPTGIGVLYGKKDALELLSPIRFGGGMVKSCSYEASCWEEIPHRFEAGTPNFVGATGLKEALIYRSQFSIEEINTYEKVLMKELEQGLKIIPGIHILGKTEQRTGCISFYVDKIHSFDIAAFLDQLGIAVRSGHHCAMPLLSHFGVDHAVRVSPSFYNTSEEIQYFLSSLEKILRLLAN